MNQPTALPPHLAERTVASSAALRPDGARYVLYWTRTALRARENPALDVALTVANALGLPLLVYHGVSERHPFANDRHHTFILEGARDLAAAYAERGIAYACHVERPGHRGPVLVQLAAHAALVVTELMPVAPLSHWTASLAAKSAAPVWQVDTACVVPMPLTTRAYDRAFAFRDATRAEREARLRRAWTDVEPTVATYDGPLPFAPVDIVRADIAELVAACEIDHAVGPVRDTRGGLVAAEGRWRAFVDGGGLARYAKVRNDATHLAGPSRLSAYLHYGMIAPTAVAREAAAIGGDSAEKWLDELLVWRELAYHFCFHRPDHDTMRAVPSWARETLAARAHERDDAYDDEALARGTTGETLWDLAQQSLLRHGELHNNLRMTWGKALVGWSATDEQALERLVALNHRYALDGRDPASFGGLLWCLGQFDRPFTPPSRAFGTVRTRPLGGHAARMDVAAYRRVVERPAHPDVGPVAVIGVGLAGTMAARTLADHGVAVTVFEKSRGSGGRAATRRDEGLQADHGAQYFTARDPNVRRLVDAWRQRGLVARWDGRFAARDDGRWRDAGAAETRWVGVPGMSAIGRHLADGLDVRYTTGISRLRRTPAGWQVEDADGRVHGPFAQVLVTTPAPQAADLIASNSEACARASAAVTFHPCQAAIVTFAQPLDVPWDGAWCNDDPVLAWVARNASKPGRARGAETWVLHGGRGFSAETLAQDSDHVAAQLVDAFRAVVASGGGAWWPPLTVTGHRWRYAIPDPVWHERAVFDAAVGLGCAGDWCGGPRVEGALLSGIAVAGRVLGAAGRPTGVAT